VSLIFLIPGAASAVTVRFGTALVGAEEVPPNTSTGAGSAFGEVDDGTRAFMLNVSSSASGADACG
jgi:hypothetical protein